MNEPIDEQNLDEHLSAFGDHELDAAQAVALWSYLAAQPDRGAAAVRRLADQQRLGIAGRRVLGGGTTHAALRARIESMCCVEEMLAREKRAADEAVAIAQRAGRWRWQIRGSSFAAAAGVAIGLGAAAMIWHPQTAGAAIVPAQLIVDEGRIHAECSRLPTDEHDAKLEAIDASLAARVRADFNGEAAPDLSAADFAFVGAGPCPAAKFNTVHLLYRSKRPHSLAAVSLFVQSDGGQFPALKVGQAVRVSGANAAFPTVAWRTGKAIYFLVGDNEELEADALRVLQPKSAITSRP